MKWFWYSLVGFCVLMCGCKSKESAHLINEVSKEQMYGKIAHFQALTDTTSVLKIDIDKSKLKIIETIKITEYDAQSGKPIKETEAEREITQDSDKVSTEEENQTVTNCNGLNVEHSRESTKKIESEVKEESGSNLGRVWEQFGKSLGTIMGIALVIGIFGRYLLKKMRVS